jgi:hypothetical protein
MYTLYMCRIRFKKSKIQKQFRSRQVVEKTGLGIEKNGDRYCLKLLKVETGRLYSVYTVCQS